MKKMHDLTKIINGIDLDGIIEDCISAVYANGTSDISVIEKLSYFKFYQPEFFKKYEQTILMKMVIIGIRKNDHIYTEVSEGMHISAITPTIQTFHLSL